MNIKDIAKKAGVGVSTVSRVLNNSDLVNPKTKLKVMEVLKEYNYKPNKAARNLVKGNYREKTIGIMMPSIAHSFFFEIIKGVYSFLKETDYNLQIFSLEKNRTATFAHIADENLAGLLVFGFGMSEDEKECLKLNNTSYLYVDYHQDGENSIYFDNYEGGRLAAEYFIGKDYKKIAFIGTTKGIQQNERFSGFVSRLSEQNIEITEEKYIEINEKESYLTTLEIENRGIEAVFYFCDEMAYGGLKAKRENKLNIDICGYDDLPLSEYIGLTTIKQPAFQLGFQAAGKILAIVDDRQAEMNVNISIKPEIIVRN